MNIQSEMSIDQTIGTSYYIRRGNVKIELYSAFPIADPSFSLWVTAHDDDLNEWGEPVITETLLTVTSPKHECEAFLVRVANEMLITSKI